jgi:hypothetical protein
MLLLATVLPVIARRPDEESPLVSLLRRFAARPALPAGASLESSEAA